MTYIAQVSAAIAYTSVYLKRAEKILSSEERNAMELHAVATPEILAIVAGTGGVRRARWGRQGS